MKKTIIAAIAALGIFASGAVSAELTAREAAELLKSSVVKTGRGCTASKIGNSMFLTAAHCAFGLNKEDMTMAVVDDDQYGIVFPRSVLFPLAPKASNNKEKDWAIVYTTDDLPSRKTLQFSCHEELYLGQKVAYYGFPEGNTTGMFGMGYIGSLKPTTGGGRADLVADLPASGGASGSPVISLDTGKIIGVLVEVVYGDRSDIYMTGLESIKNTDQCEAVIKEKDNAEKALKESGSK